MNETLAVFEGGPMHGRSILLPGVVTHYQFGRMPTFTYNLVRWDYEGGVSTFRFGGVLDS